MTQRYTPELSPPSYQLQSSANQGVPVNIGLNRRQLDTSADTFKVLLGMEYVLYVKIQNFHWNITGMSFVGLHELFMEEYKQLRKYIDQIAEQIRQYGEAAPGSMSEFLNLNQQGEGNEEVIGDTSGQITILNQAIASHESIAKFIQRLGVQELDLAAQELIGKLYDFHTKAAWMLRSHLE
jgi:starvation-inducible DNA-binding protein